LAIGVADDRQRGPPLRVINELALTAVADALAPAGHEMSLEERTGSENT